MFGFDLGVRTDGAGYFLVSDQEAGPWGPPGSTYPIKVSYPGYDDVETLGIVRMHHDRYFVSIGDDTIEWYLQFKGLYPYSPRASLPDETTDLAPAALEACLGLWITYFRKHGGNRWEIAQLLEMLTRYYRKYPGTRGQMHDLARMIDNFARFGRL